MDLVAKILAELLGQTAPTAPASYNTPLTPEEEKSFLVWKQKNAPDDSGADYDLRGAFKDGVTRKEEKEHITDKFKKPNHETFSTESQYLKFHPALAGHWDGETYIGPSRTLDLTEILQQLSQGTRQ